MIITIKIDDKLLEPLGVAFLTREYENIDELIEQCIAYYLTTTIITSTPTPIP